MRRIFLLLIICGLCVFAWRWRARPASGWQRLAPDLEIRTLTAGSASTLAGPVEVVALRTSPSSIAIARGSTLNANQWRQKDKARAVINGGYFDTDGKSLGLRICDGEKFGGLHPADWGVFFIEDGTARVLHTRDFKRQYRRTRGIAQAVQSGPRLVVNGKTTDLKPQIARRSGIGIGRDGKIVLAVSDGALSFQDWAKLWADKNGLNCRDALNLDGGGSTQISLKTKNKSLEIAGAWSVPDVIVVR